MKYLYIVFGFFISMFFMSCQIPDDPPITGCTDLNAYNYDDIRTLMLTMGAVFMVLWGVSGDHSCQQTQELLIL